MESQGQHSSSSHPIWMFPHVHTYFEKTENIQESFKNSAMNILLTWIINEHFATFSLSPQRTPQEVYSAISPILGDAAFDDK